MQILLDKVKRPGNRKPNSNRKPGNGKPHRMRDYYTTLNHSEQNYWEHIETFQT